MAAGFMLTVTLCLLILSAAVLFVLIQLVKRRAAAAIDDIMGVEEGECVSKLEQVRLLYSGRKQERSELCFLDRRQGMHLPVGFLWKDFKGT